MSDVHDDINELMDKLGDSLPDPPPGLEVIGPETGVDEAVAKALLNVTVAGLKQLSVESQVWLVILNFLERHAPDGIRYEPDEVKRAGVALWEAHEAIKALEQD